MTSHRRTAVFMQGFMAEYRVPFFHRLRHALDERDIDLVVIHGEPWDVNSTINTGTVDFAEFRRNHVVRIGPKSLTWQSCDRLVTSADLVIGVQESARLTNYYLWLRYVTGRQRFALWGHGDFQGRRASSVGESVKRFISKRVHWWFAYNETAAAVVEGLGFPADRITNVQNAIDTRWLADAVRDTTDDDLRDLRERHDLVGCNTCIYIGGMYTEKRLPYLLAACDHLREQVDDFEMVFLGGGPDEHLVIEAAATRPWLHHVGPTLGVDKARYLRLAKLLLVPGAVGLVVLDSFAAGVPLVTLSDREHGPEIGYLTDGENGRVLPGDTTPAQYAGVAAELLRDDETRTRLAKAGRVAGDTYTIEAMVERYADGIEHALDTPLRPS